MKLTITTELDITSDDFAVLTEALSKELPVIVDKTCGDNSTEFLQMFATYDRYLEQVGIILDTVPVEIREA